MHDHGRRRRHASPCRWISAPPGIPASTTAARSRWCRTTGRATSAFTNDPYSGYRRDAYARPASVEAGVPSRARSSLRRRPHPQHRHGRRGARQPVARADRDPSGRHPLSADEALRTGRAERGHCCVSCCRTCASPSRTSATSRRLIGALNTGERKVQRDARQVRRGRGSRQGLGALLDYAEHAGARDPADHARRRICLRRLCRRGLRWWQSLPAGADAAHPAATRRCWTSPAGPAARHPR